ncbi:unnamed protein product [Natator depressus]
MALSLLAGVNNAVLGLQPSGLKVKKKNTVQIIQLRKKSCRNHMNVLCDISLCGCENYSHQDIAKLDFLYNLSELLFGITHLVQSFSFSFFFPHYSCEYFFFSFHCDFFKKHHCHKSNGTPGFYPFLQQWQHILHGADLPQQTVILRLLLHCLKYYW